jgi:hypothetical protein
VSKASDTKADDKPLSQRQASEGPDRPSHVREVEARPTGHPTSDRHAAETAHYWEDEVPETPEPPESPTETKP